MNESYFREKFGTGAKEFVFEISDWNHTGAKTFLMSHLKLNATSRDCFPVISVLNISCTVCTPS